MDASPVFAAAPVPDAAPPAPLAHATVLPAEAVQALVGRADGVYVDATFGRGGHARGALARLSASARLVVLDRDPEAIACAAELAAADARVVVRHARFGDMAVELAALGVRQVDGVLLDLGVSSPQLDDAARGFSFRHDGPLDMRMDPTRGESAADFLARAEVQRIAEVIRDYGEERFALPIAKALAARRQDGRPVRTTAELARLVAGAVKTREPGKDPATRTFQALRIHVNAELDELAKALDAALAVLAPGGRLVVISFHSLEDRMVKAFIARHGKSAYDRRAPFAAPAPTLLAPIARVRPGEVEVRQNPRARSAVMRVAERTAAPLTEATP